MEDYTFKPLVWSILIRAFLLYFHVYYGLDEDKDPDQDE